MLRNGMWFVIATQTISMPHSGSKKLRWKKQQRKKTHYKIPSLFRSIRECVFSAQFQTSFALIAYLIGIFYSIPQYNVICNEINVCDIIIFVSWQRGKGTHRHSFGAVIISVQLPTFKSDFISWLTRTPLNEQRKNKWEIKETVNALEFYSI